jgi:hypothetical protein
VTGVLLGCRGFDLGDVSYVFRPPSASVARRRNAHLERDRVRVWVLEVESLGDLLLEGPCSVQSLSRFKSCTAQLTLEAQLHGIELNRHCGRTGSMEVPRVLCW